MTGTDKLPNIDVCCPRSILMRECRHDELKNIMSDI